MTILEKVIVFLNATYPNYKGLKQISGGGSEREYFRFLLEKESFLITYNENTKENKGFFSMSQKLSKSMPESFPQVFEVSEDYKIYVQTDFGNQSLLELLKNDRENAFKAYQQVVSELPKIQFYGAQQLSEKDFFDEKEFHEMLIFRDLFYFKNYFVDLLGLSNSQSALLRDFKKLAQDLTQTHYQHFMYRDFQARNIMVIDNKPKYIDFQGGMKGPIAYDLVSLLWQAKASLSKDWKKALYEIYTENWKDLVSNFSEELFGNDYQKCLIIRVLQVLGAYGKLGIIEKKSHFLESLELGVKNLSTLFNEKKLEDYPEIESIARWSQDIDFKKIVC